MELWTGWERDSRAVLYCRFGLGFSAREGALPVMMQAPSWLSQAIRNMLVQHSYCVGYLQGSEFR